MDDDKDGGAPSAKAISGEGYNQTYIILSRASDADSKLSVDANEVFFRCGNWCYKGFIQFGALSIGTADLPTLIPALQRQQGSLRYYCNAKRFVWACLILLLVRQVYYDVAVCRRIRNFMSPSIS
jgi:hypothetical protein